MSLAERLRAAQLPPPAMRRTIRLNAGASLREVAEELGVTPLTVARWERGEAEPRRGSAIAYRKVLDDLVGVSR
jgi:transcriptional regulator with XRE-family HTH domain